MLQTVRGLLGFGVPRLAPWHAEAVRSRVDLPMAYWPAGVVLRALRALDPNLDQYFLPDGRCWILHRQENRERIQAGRAELLDAKVMGWQEPMYTASLMAQGFWLVGEVPFWEGRSAGACVTLAQRVLYATEEQVRENMRRRRAVADSSAQAEERARVIRDRIASSARSDWARTYRGRRYFSYEGTKRATG